MKKSDSTFSALDSAGRRKFINSLFQKRTFLNVPSLQTPKKIAPNLVCRFESYCSIESFCSMAEGLIRNSMLPAASKQ